MADVEIGIDASRARSGGRSAATAFKNIATEARRASNALKLLQKELNQLRALGNIQVKINVNQVAARQAEAGVRQIKALEKELARERERATKFQNRLDAERYKEIERNARAARRAQEREERRAAAEARRLARQTAREQQRIQNELYRDRLRAARQQSRIDAQNLREQERIAVRLANLRRRISPQDRTRLNIAEANRDITRAVERGLISQRAALRLRSQAIQHFQSEAQAAGQLGSVLQNLASSFSTMSRASATSVPILLTMEESMRRMSGTLGGAAGAGLIGGVLALGAAFASIEGVKSIASAAIEFQKIQGALRAATGSAEAAREEFNFIVGVSQQLGIELEASGVAYAKLAASARQANIPVDQTRALFLGTAEAAAALRLSAAQTSGILFAFEQIISKGTLVSEELKRQLGDRLPGAFAIAAQALGRTSEQLTKDIERGLISAQEFIPAIARALQQLFAGEAAQASNELLGSINKLKNEFFLLKVEIAEGGLTETLTQIFRDLRNTLRDPDVRQGLQDIASLLGGTLQFMVDNASSILAILGALPGAAAGFLVGGPVGALVGGAVTGKLTEQALQNVGDTEAEELRELATRYQKLKEAAERASGVQRAGLLKQAAEVKAAFDAQVDSIIKATVAEQELAQAVESARNPQENQKDRIQRLRNEYEKFITNLDDVRKATKEYEDAVRTAGVFLKEGVIDQEQFNHVVRLAQADYDAATRKTKEATSASREHQRALEKEAEARREAQIELIAHGGELDQRISDLKEEIRATREGEQALEALKVQRAGEEAAIEATRLALERKLPLDAEEIDLYRKKGEEVAKLEQELKRVEDQRKAEEELAKQRAKEEAELLQEPFLEAARNIQNSFAQLFKDIFSGGVDSAKDLANQMLKIFTDLAAELASVLVIRPVLQGVAGAVLGGQGGGQLTQQLLGSALGKFGSSILNAGTTGGATAAGAGSAASGVGIYGSIISGAANLGSILGGGLTNTVLPQFAQNFILDSVIRLGGTAQLAGNIVRSFNPLTSLGGLVGGLVGSQVLGLTSGNAYADTALTTTGSILGGIAGTTYLTTYLGATFAGPIGAAIGAILGLAAGAIVGSFFEDSNKDLPDLRLLTATPTEALRADIGDFAGARTAARQAGFSKGFVLESPFGIVGVEAKGSSGGDLPIKAITRLVKGVDEVIAATLTEEQIAAAGEALQSQRAFFAEDIGSAKSGNFRVIFDRLNTVLNTILPDSATTAQEFIYNFGGGGAFQSVLKTTEAEGKTINEAAAKIARSVIDKGITEEDLQEFVEGVVELLTQRRQVIDSINEFLERGEPISEGKQAIRDIEQAFDDLVAAGERLYLSQEQIADIELARVKALEKLKTDTNRDIELRTLAFTDPLTAALEELADRQEKERQNVIDVGGDIVALERLHGLERLAVIEEFNNEATSSFRDGLNRIQELINEMLGGSSSPLSAQEVFQNAFNAFTTDTLKLFLGDPTQQGEALQSITTSAQNLLEAAQAMFASGPEFFRIFNLVLDTLQRSQTLDPATPVGFATGGSFSVPAGAGPDSKLISFGAAGGERVSISTKSDQAEMSKVLKELGAEMVRGKEDNRELLMTLIREVRKLNQRITRLEKIE